jgi:thioredoxin-related protein
LEETQPLHIALSVGIGLAVLEVVVEKLYTGKVHTISRLNFGIIFLLGLLALFAREGVWFKLQPTMTGYICGTWLTLNQALEEAAKKPKKILIDVYTNWCPPCKMLNQRTFGNPDIAKYINENYYAVKFNAEGNQAIEFKGRKYQNPEFDANKSEQRNGTHEFTMVIAPVNGRIAYPTVVFLTEKGDLITNMQGFIPAKDFEPVLYFIQNEAYAKGITFNDYLKNFNGKIKQ